MIHDDNYPSIKKIADWLSTPEIRERIFFTLKQIEAEEGACLKSYTRGLATFKESILESEDFQAANRKEAMADNGYWFEAIQTTPARWVLDSIKPAPPPDLDEKKVLPLDLIADMGRTPVNPEEIVRWPKAASQITGATYRLTFMHPSKYYISGAVRPHLDEYLHREEVYTNNSGIDERIAYQTLFSYMVRYPKVKDYFFAEFFYKVKPLLDGALEKSEIKKKDLE